MAEIRLRGDSKMFVKILADQHGISRAKGWDDTRMPEITRDKQGCINIAFPGIDVGFVFSRTHRFVGMFNWKE